MAETPTPEPSPAAGSVPSVPTVQLSAERVVHLESRAKVADRLEQKYSENVKAIAVSESMGSTHFVNDTARLHASQILGARVVVKLDPDGDPQAYDSVTGRPAREVLPELVAGPEFAIYRRPSHQGGGGGGNGPAPSNPGGVQPGAIDGARQAALVAEMTAHRGGPNAGGLLSPAGIMAFGEANGQRGGGFGGFSRGNPGQ